MDGQKCCRHHRRCRDSDAGGGGSGDGGQPEPVTDIPSLP